MSATTTQIQGSNYRVEHGNNISKYVMESLFLFQFSVFETTIIYKPIIDIDLLLFSKKRRRYMLMSDKLNNSTSMIQLPSNYHNQELTYNFIHKRENNPSEQLIVQEPLITVSCDIGLWSWFFLHFHFDHSIRQNGDKPGASHVLNIFAFLLYEKSIWQEMNRMKLKSIHPGSLTIIKNQQEAKHFPFPSKKTRM